jgi:hypothetical protein
MKGDIMVISNVRVDWVFVFEPNKNDKYGVCVMLSKGSPQEDQVKKAIDKAKAAGIAAGKFTAAHTKSASFKPCLRDGDQEIETEDRPKHYKGMSFFNASSPTQPGIVDEHVQPLLEAGKLYSGCFVNVDVNFYAYNHPKGGKGIGAGLNHIMFVREGERLDGRVSAEEAFSGMEAADGELQ